MKPDTIEVNAEPVIGILAQTRDSQIVHNELAIYKDATLDCIHWYQLMLP